MFTIFAGIYYWFPKMTGRMYDETLGKLHFWLTFIFFNLTFGPMHWSGIEGMPRRVADYADKFAAWNLVISISAFIFGLSILVFVYNMITSLAPRPAGRGQPVARAHARVAGVLAAADLQLRRDPDGGRRPVRVRRARAPCTRCSRRRRRRRCAAPAGGGGAPPTEPNEADPRGRQRDRGRASR